MQKNIEVLAPVSSFAHLMAAISGGANAVYLGVGEHNARQMAKNISLFEVKKAIALCHNNNVKVYGALNTLVSDRELKSALNIAKVFYENGADGIIVQDEGLASLIKQAYPNIPLHASTQMSVHSLDGVLRLAKKGFKRVVLARELSKEDIIYITKNSPIQIEVFVHGALCMCFSGQCYMSAVIGRRSGNRGLCAQPCRLPYFYEGKTIYPLSLKDLYLGDFVKELKDMGVASIKIEGRMKRAEFVYAVTKAYREAADGKEISLKEKETLANVFSREGFTDGYYNNNLGKNMFGIRKDSDKLISKNTFLNIAKNYENNEENINIPEQSNIEINEVDIKVTPIGKKGKPVLEARFSTTQQIPKNIKELGINLIWLPFDELVNNVKFKIIDVEIGIELPRVIEDKNKNEFLNKLSFLKREGINKALCGTYDLVEKVREIGFEVHSNFSFNIYNSFSVKEAKNQNIKSATLSLELSFPQIRDMQKEIPCGIIGYGHIPLMFFKNCVIKNISKCGKCKEKFKLKDRANEEFFIVKEYNCYNSLLNSKPIYLADKEEHKKCGLSFIRLYFTIENCSECERIIKSYSLNEPPKGEFTRGLYFKGVI